MRCFFSGFHCKMKNNKKTKGRRAKRAAPLGRCRRRRLVVFRLAVETRNKKPHGNRFFIKGWPNFWPRIENRLWVVLALNKIPPSLNKKTSRFLIEVTIRIPTVKTVWGIS